MFELKEIRKLVKIGNSYYLPVPKKYIKEAKMALATYKVELAIKGDDLSIRPALDRFGEGLEKEVD